MTDEAAVERQLGRPPRAVRRVAHRCPCGLPDVVETAPRLSDGTPFPTLYYLTCPRAVAAVSRLEAVGAMREMQQRLVSDAVLRRAYLAAHRDYLARRDEAARAAGVEPQHYVLLLQVKGFERRRPATIGALTERLQIRHHATVQLVDRLAQRGMVRRRRADLDRRGVVVELTSRGEAVLRKLALNSMAELRTGGPALASTLTRVVELNGAGQPRAKKSRR